MLSMMFGIVTVLLVGVLVLKMYNSKKAELAMEADKTEVVMEKVGEVDVEVKEDGKKYPTKLADKVVVAAGDNLWTIAEKHYGSGYNWVEIAKANGLKNADRLLVGQELTLPQVAVITIEAKTVATPITITGASYTVVKGDNLWSIAVRAYGDGYKWVEIAKTNNLASPNYIEVGQVIKLTR